MEPQLTHQDKFSVKELFQIPYFTLGILKAWPTEKRKWPQKIHAFLLVQYFLWYCVSCFVKVYWTLLDFDILRLADALAVGLTIFTTLLKFVIFTGKHRAFFDILNELMEFFREGKVDILKKELMPFCFSRFSPKSH